VNDGYSQLDVFTAAVARLGELLEQGALRVKVASNGHVAFTIDKDATEVPEHGNGVYLDIHDVLTAIVLHDPLDEFIAARADQDGDGSSEQARADWQAKFAAAAAAFPASKLRPSRWSRARAGARALSTRAIIAAAKRSGWLGRTMAWYWFRRLLGGRGRRLAWCALGARIADTASIGPGVTMRQPYNVTVGAGTKLGGRVRLEAFGEITIGRNVLMNDADLYSTQHDVNHPRFAPQRRFVRVGDYAWLPHKIIVLPGVTIGSYAVVGTGSVVSRDVPDYGVAVGNPARVVKERARIRYTYVPSSVQRAPMQ
jgi:acetyltransferase-like isoleucine patch superfamily enzyme